MRLAPFDLVTAVMAWAGAALPGVSVLGQFRLPGTRYPGALGWLGAAALGVRWAWPRLRASGQLAVALTAVVAWAALLTWR